MTERKPATPEDSQAAVLICVGLIALWWFCAWWFR